jgi:uncharacterized protein YjbI with pentapeptide repeats
MASPNPYDDLNNAHRSGLSRSSFVGGNRQYALLKEFIPNAARIISTSTPGVTGRRPRAYSATLSPQNNQPQQMTMKSLLAKLEKQSAREQAKTLVNAPAGLLQNFPWQKLNWENQFIGNVPGLNKLPLSKIKMNGADFQDADLTNASLEGAQINGAKFGNAKLGEARMAGAQANGASFGGADLNGSTMSTGNFTNANFTRASLKGVGATRTNFGDSHGDGVQLSGNFSGANLGVRFADSGIGSGNYNDAVVANAQFADTTGLDNLKGAKGTPKVTSSNLAMAISTSAPAPSETTLRTPAQKPNELQIAALTDKPVVAVRPPQPRHAFPTLMPA